MADQLPSDSAALDAELLLCHVLQVDSTYLRTWPDKPLTEQKQLDYLAVFEQRLQGVPVAHITGHRGFWSLDLETNASTLIPRPDTECLVEHVLEMFDGQPRSVLDLGTGTGAIVLALAVERPRWTISACDLSPDAVALAKRNALRHEISSVEFLCGSWFEPFVQGQRFDLVVSNPPYIDPDDPHLTAGDLRFEPKSALVADKKGLADIEHIAERAPTYLKPGGWLYFEHGYQQSGAVQAIYRDLGYQSIQTKKDYGGNDRFTLAQYR